MFTRLNESPTTIYHPCDEQWVDESPTTTTNLLLPQQIPYYHLPPMRWTMQGGQKRSERQPLVKVWVFFPFFSFTNDLQGSTNLLLPQWIPHYHLPPVRRTMHIKRRALACLQGSMNLLLPYTTRATNNAHKKEGASSKLFFLLSSFFDTINHWYIRGCRHVKRGPNVIMYISHYVHFFLFFCCFFILWIINKLK